MAHSTPIKTSRLEILPFSSEHLTPRYVGWLNDIDIVRYSEQRHYQHTLESCRQYWQSFDHTPHYFWAIVAHDPTLGHIGNINAYIDPYHAIADIGILLGERQAWKKGYASEAWLAVCHYLLTQNNIRKITAGTIAPNQAMLKLMQNTGMVEDGRRHQHYIWEGQAVDVIYAALFTENL